MLSLVNLRMKPTRTRTTSQSLNKCGSSCSPFKKYLSLVQRVDWPNISQIRLNPGLRLACSWDSDVRTLVHHVDAVALRQHHLLQGRATPKVQDRQATTTEREMIKERDDSWIRVTLESSGRGYTKYKRTRRRIGNPEPRRNQGVVA